MRGYHYTRAQVMAEPVLAFWTLLQALDKLEATEDLRALNVAAVAAHPGEHGAAYDDLVDDLTARLGRRRERTVAPERRIVPGVTPGTSIEERPGEIAALRRRQAENAERMRREWEQRQREREQERQRSA